MKHNADEATRTPDTNLKQQTQDEKRNQLPLDGVIAIAKVNKKKRFFAASKHNYFGGWQVETMMIHSGCSSILLPLRENEVLQVFEKFKPEEHHFDIGKSRGTSLTLKVTRRIGRIDVRLCADFLKEMIPIPFLRFHLCKADLELLKDHPLLNAKQHQSIATALGTAAAAGSATEPQRRRVHGLIGQSILFDPNVLFQLYTATLVVDPTRFALSGWPALLAFEDLVVKRALLPENFDDLEADDGDEEEGVYIPGDDDYFD